jgi:hypothetical protein
MKRALVISLICVLGLAFTGLAASLSGSWDTDITIDPQQTNFNDAIGIDSVLTVVYTVGDWAFTSVTILDETGWLGQNFAVAGVLGAFSIASDLVFDPAAPAFTSWGVNTGVSIAGVSFDVEFDLVPNDVQLVLSASGVAGDVSVGVEVTFGGLLEDNGCDLDWAGVEISLGFPFCCADIAAVITFDCSGFEQVCFTAGGIAVPNMPYLTLDAEICFTVDEKTLTLTPSFDFGDIACFDIDFDAEWTGLSIVDIAITGIGLTCDIGAVTFEGYSYLGELPDGVIYWEYYIISTNDDACCGPFGFDLGFYFLDQGIRLFDIGLIDANMTLQVASQFAFNMGLEINVETGAFTLWTVGFEVTW